MGLTAAEITKDDFIFVKSNGIKFALEVRT